MFITGAALIYRPLAFIVAGGVFVLLAKAARSREISKEES
jgi:hypothetical protein